MPFKTLARFGRLHKIAEKIEKGEEPVERDMIDIMNQRTSVRKYIDKDVPDELILEVLDAGRHAPSAGNHQPWEFIVVKSFALRKAIVESCYGQEWMLGAPVFIVACINMRLAGAVYGERGMKLFGIQDVAAACQNILLAAESLGLGTCWVGDFAEKPVANLLQCSETVRPAVIITLGYPVKKEEKPFLHSLEEVVHIERYGETLKLKEITEEKYSTI